MCLATFEQRQHGQCATAVGIVLTEDGEGDQYLIGMQTWIMTTQIYGFGFLNRLYQVLRDKLDAVVYTSQMLCGIQQQ